MFPTEVVEDELVDEVASEFRPEFERDIDGAIRDILARPTMALHPVLRDNVDRALPFDVPDHLR